MAVDGYVGNVVREEAAGGRAALAVSCVVGCAGACEPAVDEFALRQIKPFVQRPGEKTRRCGSPARLVGASEPRTVRYSYWWESYPNRPQAFSEVCETPKFVLISS